MTHAGCSLKLILDWAWDRVVDIKDQLDQLCKNSFVDHHNSLLVDSFKKLKKELTALLPLFLPSLEMLPMGVGNIGCG